MPSDPSVQNDPSVKEDLAKVRDAAAASNGFALDMYRELAGSNGNIFFSPWSLSLALSMTYEGARGRTAEQMRSVLHFSGDESARRQSISLLDRQITGNEPGYLLSTANAVWVDHSFSLLAEYVQLVDQVYQARATNLDFAGASEESRKIINSWVEEKTRDKIKDLIPPDYITPLTCLILTNAIYFKGTWEKEFDKKLTKEEKFYISESRTAAVPMMKSLDKDARFGYLETEELQILQMPYVGQRLSLVVLLPRTDSIDELESTLNLERLAGWKSQLRKKRVDVYLPRFKIDAKYFLKKNLKDLGMRSAFEGADFSGISDEAIFISSVIHQAYVDVNEEGTEAAAATAVIFARSVSISPSTPVFRADRPFLFMITDDETGLILFLGRLSDPEAK